MDYTIDGPLRVLASPEFNEWLGGLDRKGRAQVLNRLDRIRVYGHFGDSKTLGDDLLELRWRSGRRVYFAFFTDEQGIGVLMLAGGDKNGQERDIAQARRVLERDAP